MLRFLSAILLIALAIQFASIQCVSQSLNLSFNHLTVNDGLSQGVNNCIFRDSKGYTWISSFDGLNRFDGIDCIVYRDIINNPGSLKGTLFLNILEDKNNNLWIGSNEGLNFYNRKTNSFTCYYSPDGKFVNQTFSPFYIDSQNNIWVQSGQNIMLFNSTTKRFKKVYSSPATGNLIIRTSPYAQLQSLKKILLSSQAGNEILVAVADTNQLQFSTFLKAPSIHINDFWLENDKLWLACRSGLFYYNGTALSNIPLNSPALISSNVLQLYLADNKTLWAGTEKDGLFNINTETLVSSFPWQNSVYNPYSLSGNRVHYIYKDEENNLWVSVWGKGVDYTNLEKFRFPHFLTRPEANSENADNFIRSIIETKNNNFWCGTQLSGILVLNEHKKILKKITKGLPSSIEHLFKDSHSKIWIATLSGLFTANEDGEKLQPIKGFEKYQPRSNQFNYIWELKNNTIAASTNAGIFFITDTGEKITNVSPNGTNNDVFLTSFQSSNGDIFLSRAFKGFSVFQPQDDSIILKKDFASQSTVKCFAETNDSIIWIGTTRGLIRFNKKNLAISKIYTTEDGLNNQYVYGILPDGNDLWLSTNSGISKFNTTNERFKNYTSNDGLQSNEFNTYSFCKTTNGELLFGGINGINAFFPAGLKDDLHIPDIRLQKININDTLATSLNNPEDITALNLSYSQNTVSFQFAVIDYTNPQDCSFLYHLEGYDKDWIGAANKSIIRYANLPSGHYTLKIKSVNASGVIGNSVYSLKISIATPWYNSWWFNTAMALAIALAVWFFIHNYYRRKMEKQKILIEKELAIEQERTRMARELHDGLGSMLSGIKHSFSAMEGQMNMDVMQQQRFHSNVERLNETINELRNISHSMATENALKFGLENSLRDYCRNIEQPAGFTISFSALNTENLKLSEETTFHIFRIIQELLQNIVKHANAKHAIVQLSYSDSKLYVTVEDDGAGFDLSAAPEKKGIGLKNIEARVKIIKGHIDFKTEPDKGTSVMIEVPVK